MQRVTLANIDPMRVHGSVSLSALNHNLAIVRRHAPSAHVMAVLKKNAYGHGLVPVARSIESQVDGMAVAAVEEAVELRDAGIASRICLLSGFYAPGHVEVLENRAIEAVVYCNEQLEVLSAAKLNRLTVWVKFDTGMNRLGFPVRDYRATMQRVCANTDLTVAGIMTHFAAADELDSDFTQRQISQFRRYTASWDGSSSMANSAGILRWPECRSGWVRPGIMLYGASPFPTVAAGQLDLQPVMNLYSRIIAVKTLEQGDRVGYGLTWKAAGTKRIGIVACGYGDGYHRSASSKARVLIGERQADVVGRISMDSFAIDLTGFPDAAVGAPVKLFGKGLPAEELAAAAGTIPYEVFTSLNPKTVSLCYE